MVAVIVAVNLCFVRNMCKRHCARQQWQQQQQTVGQFREYECLLLCGAISSKAIFLSFSILKAEIIAFVLPISCTVFTVFRFFRSISWFIKFASHDTHQLSRVNECESRRKEHTADSSNHVKVMWGQWGLKSMQIRNEIEKWTMRIAHTMVSQERERQMAIDSCQFEMVSAVFGRMVLVAFNRQFILLLSEWNIWPYFNAHYPKSTQQGNGCIKWYALKVLQHTSHRMRTHSRAVCALPLGVVLSTHSTIHSAHCARNTQWEKSHWDSF